MSAGILARWTSRSSQLAWRQGWTPLVLLLGLFLLGYRDLIGFSPISPVNEMRDEVAEGQLYTPNQKSMALIFALATYFFCMRIGRLRNLVGNPPAMGASALLFAVGFSFSVWSHYTGETALAIISLSVTLLATAAMLGGVQALRVMRLPALFVLLAVPIPAVLLNSIIFELQLFTADSVGLSLSLLGVQHAVSGESIATADRIFQVIEGCSGLRTMETILMAGIVYQELVPHSRAYSWLVVLSAPLFGLIANHLRVLSIILYPDAGISGDHMTQGILMTIVGTLMMIGFGSLIARILPADTSRGAVGGSRAKSVAWPLRRLAVVVIILGAISVATLGEPWEVDRPAHKNPTRLPGRFDGWVAKAIEIDEQFLGSTHYTQAIHRDYERGHETVRVFLGSDSRKTPLVSGVSPKHASLGRTWQVLWEREVPFESNSEIAALASVQSSMGKFSYVISWQQGVDSYPREVARSALALDRSPWQRPYNAYGVRISTSIPAPGTQHEMVAHRRIMPFVDLVRENFSIPVGQVASSEE